MCSFSTEQTDVTLYMTAIASLSTLVKTPIVKVLYLLSVLVNGSLILLDIYACIWWSLFEQAFSGLSKQGAGC